MGMLRRPFREGLFWGLFRKAAFLRRTMCPSYTLHVAAVAFRADADISFPHSFEQFSAWQACVSGFEPLVPLQCEDQFQVFTFSAVVQKAIVADFTETRWQYMHQITANEFFMGQSNCSAGFSGFFTSCGEGNLMFVVVSKTTKGDHLPEKL